MTGSIISTPPPIDLPPGSTSGGTAVLPPYNVTYAIPSSPQTWTGLQTFVNGSMQFAGSTSGNTFLNATAIASGTLSLPAETGTLATQAYVLANSTTATFTQDGTGAVPVSYDSLFRKIIVTPEMFGAIPSLVFDSSAAIQRAINYLASVHGGTVKFSNALYSTNAPVVISTKGITLEGYQPATGNGTEIYFTPSAVGQKAISITAGASIASDILIKNLSIRSPDTTTYKIGIGISDGSHVTLRDLFIYDFLGGVSGTITGAVANGSGEIRLTVSGAATNWNDGWAVAVSGVVGTTEANYGWPIVVSGANTIDLKGSVFTNAYVSGGTITASSTGIQVKGRELIVGENVAVLANLAMRISANPNLSTNSLDQTNFYNMSLFSTGTNPVVMADDGTVLSSVHFLGTQSWGGGKDGFAWRDITGPAISQQLRFDNVRAEQKSVAGGAYFNIRPNQTLYSLQIVGPLLADRDGFIVRNTANLQIDNAHYLNATGVALDINSTVQNTQINGSYWVAGSTATLTGQTLVMSSGKNPSTGALAPYAVYANAAVGAQLGTPAALVGTNISGTAASLTAGTATNAVNSGITNDTATNATMFPAWVTANTGNLPLKVTSTKLTFNPSTGVLSSTSFTGAGTGLTGTAASLTAGAVTTNANLTGAVTSVGNATSLGSFSSANLRTALTDETGAGAAVFADSPTFSGTIQAAAINLSGSFGSSGTVLSVGPGGAGATTVSAIFDGGSAVGGGVQFNLRRNSANIWAFAHTTTLIGGATDDFGFYNFISGAFAYKLIATTNQAQFIATTASTSSTTGGATFGGGVGVAGALYAGGEIATGSVTVATLPAASGRRGARHFVTDANATLTAGIGAVVAGGGANGVPVVSDNTNWRIG